MAASGPVSSTRPVGGCSGRRSLRAIPRTSSWWVVNWWRASSSVSAARTFAATITCGRSTVAVGASASKRCRYRAIASMIMAGAKWEANA